MKSIIRKPYVRWQHSLLLDCLLVLILAACANLPETPPQQSQQLPTGVVVTQVPIPQVTQASTSPHLDDRISISNIEHLHSLTVLGRGRVEWLSLSPDLRLLAIASTLGVSLYNYPGLEKVGLLEHSGSTIVVFAPDGMLLASGSLDGTVKLWRVSDMSLLHTFEGHVATVSSIAFSSDGTLMASISKDTTIQIRRVSDGQLLQNPALACSDPDSLLEGGGPQVKFSPDNRLITAYACLRLQIWEISNGKPLSLMDSHADANVYNYDFSPDGKLLAVSLLELDASGSFNGIKLWDTVSGSLLRKWETDLQSTVAFLPTGDLLVERRMAEREGKGSMLVWQVSTGKLIDKFEISRDFDTSSIFFSPNGQILVLLDGLGKLGLWRVSGWKALYELETNMLSGNISFSSDGNTLILSPGPESSLHSESRNLDEPSNIVLQLRDMSDGTLQRMIKLADLRLYSDPVTSIGFLPNGDILATGSSMGLTYLWNLSDGSQLASYNSINQNNPASIEHIYFSQDGGLMVSAGFGSLQIRKISNGSLLEIYKRESTEKVIPSPDGSVWAVLGNDGVSLVHPSDKSARLLLKGSSRNAVFSNDGHILAVDTPDGTQLWQLTTEKQLPTMEHSAEMDQITFSSDNQILAASSHLGILLLRISDGRMLHTLDSGKALGDLVNSLAFSPDGELLASAHRDSTVRLWSTSSGQLLLTLKDHTRGVNYVAFSPDGKLLASGSDDGTVRLWGLR